MSEWKEVKLGDIIDLVIDYRGKTPKKLGGDWSSSGYRALSAKNIKTGQIVQKESIRYVDESLYKRWMQEEVKRGDILITSEAPFGQIYLWDSDEKIVLSQRLFDVRIRKEHNSTFVYYQMQTRNFQSELDGRTTGTTVVGLRQPELLKCHITIPDINTQNQISGILSSLDAKIETNNKLNEKLEEMAQAIFKSWFVDFEPFKDKPFHDTELGMIPEGWEVKRLCDIVDIIGGYSYKGNELKESTTAMCTIKNFERNGGFKIDGYKEIIPSDKLKESQELSLFDVVVAHTDLTQNAEVIGNPAIILSKSNYDRIIFSMDLTKVISKNMNVSKSLLYCILRNKRFKNHALGYVNGTTVLHMSKKAVPDYMLAFPKDSVILASLSKCFDSIFGRMHEIYEENDRLASLRDTLLPRLMSGELIV